MFSTRFITSAVLGALFALAPAAASAHTELTSSDPADGSTLTEAPTEVMLTFEGEISEDSTFTVTGPAGDEVGSGELDLDVAERNVLRGEVTVEEAGEYVVAYAIVGEDGDPIEGEVTFTFDAEGTASPATPNTAMVAPVTASPTVLAGIAFLALAGVVAARRALRI